MSTIEERIGAARLRGQEQAILDATRRRRAELRAQHEAAAMREAARITHSEREMRATRRAAAAAAVELAQREEQKYGHVAAAGRGLSLGARDGANVSIFGYSSTMSAAPLAAKQTKVVPREPCCRCCSLEDFSIFYIFSVFSGLWSAICWIFNAVRIRSCFGRRSRFLCCGYCGDQPHVTARTTDDDKVAALLCALSGIGLWYLFLFMAYGKPDINNWEYYIAGPTRSAVSFSAVESTSVWMGKPIYSTTVFTCVGGFIEGVAIAMFGAYHGQKARSVVTWIRNLSGVGAGAYSVVWYARTQDMFSFVMGLASAVCVFAGSSIGRVLNFMLCCEHSGFSEPTCPCALCVHETAQRLQTVDQEKQQRLAAIKQATLQAMQKQDLGFADTEPVDDAARPPAFNPYHPLNQIAMDKSAEVVSPPPPSWNSVKAAFSNFAAHTARRFVS